MNPANRLLARLAQLQHRAEHLAHHYAFHKAHHLTHMGYLVLFVAEQHDFSLRALVGLGLLTFACVELFEGGGHV